MSKLPPFDVPGADEKDAIFLVNVVHVHDGQQDKALEVLWDTVSYVARTYPSFRWSRLFKSSDGKTVINQAQWSSRAEFESLFQDPEFLGRYNGLKQYGSWEYHLYTVEHFIPAAPVLTTNGALPLERG
ncbi:antibiotic biosynthesis monooxygenase family protein [Pseudomonas fulva]|nr:antibiotic biosynthesis monooxygenase [Pseudomonas fulva]MBF8781979.1 antibiotic biosynthesis monooxygenase [Pseudomonas fulva]